MSNKIKTSVARSSAAVIQFFRITDREILQDAGKVTAEIAKAHGERAGGV